MLFHMSKKEVVYYAHPCPIQYPCLENKFSVSDNQYPSKYQDEDKSSFQNLLYVMLPEEKKIEKKIKICLAYVTPRLPTSVHRKIQPIRSSRLPAQREQKHIYE